MKKTQKITFSGLLSAFAVAVMFAAFFPYATYSVPAIAGLAVMLTFIEAGAFYALGTYIVSGVLSFVFCEKESALLYLFLFGIYPIIKAYFEKVKNRVVEWIIKMLYFNLSAAVSLAISVYVLGIPMDDYNAKWMIYAFWVLYNLFFVLYDICLSKLSVLYLNKYHRIVVKIFGKIK